MFEPSDSFNSTPVAPGPLPLGGRAVRFAGILGLIVLLYLATVPILDLVEERRRTRDDVVREVAGTWGGAQVVGAPVVSLPLCTVDPRTGILSDAGYYHVLPRELTVTGEVTPVLRYRTLYPVVLYSARLRLEGSFDLPGPDAPELVDYPVRRDQSVVSVGISDLRGIRDGVRLLWNGKALDLEPGRTAPNLFPAGISARGPAVAAADAGGRVRFSLELTVNGSEDIRFLPLGETTTVRLRSPWPDPGFGGAFLPDTRRIGPAGFEASWKVLKFNRNFPQHALSAGTDFAKDLTRSAFGVRLVYPVDGYQKVTRSLKYAILFIFLTFVAFFLAETRSPRRPTLVQYLLAGVALVVFYTLLLSLSEVAGFDSAYGFASLGVLAQVGLFARGIFGSTGSAVAVGGVLAALYGVLYVILRLEDTALLVGSLLLFVVTGVLMYFFRRTD
ncbi:MAG: cell envelope integrity protein CreD [Acidobacteria bacterium]|nr:cell envelope integrity protein CreD [Acidobacteriota bacterium]